MSEEKPVRWFVIFFHPDEDDESDRGDFPEVDFLAAR